jgi:hypothetical protein
MSAANGNENENVFWRNVNNVNRAYRMAAAASAALAS